MNQNIQIKDVFCPDRYTTIYNDRVYGEVQYISYYSKTTGCNRGANIYLPAGYSRDRKYPVVYFQHGIFGNEFAISHDFKCAIPVILGNLAAEGEIRDTIVVFPNMYATGDPALQPGFTDEQIAPYDNFIHDMMNDLIPYIEEHYSVYTDRENRGIFGFSMGGRETLFIALSRPEVFGYVGAISPAPGLTPCEDMNMKHPGQLKEEELSFDGQTVKPEIVLIGCGTRDSVVGTFPRHYHELMEQNGMEHVWYEIPDVDHEQRAIRSAFYNFMIHCFKNAKKCD